ILAIGNMVYPSLKAADLLAIDGSGAEVVNMRFVKSIDHALIENICARFDYVLTVEDHVVTGGFGSAVLESLAARPHPHLHVKVHGVPGDFIEQGTPQELYAM